MRYDKETIGAPVRHSESFVRADAQSAANRDDKPRVVLQNPQTWHFMALERWEVEREHLEACGNVLVDTLYPTQNEPG